jgi:membrane-associated phospholipid phosphatase
MNPQVLSSESSIIVTFLASFLIWVMFGGIAFLWIIDGRVKKELALHAFLSVVTSWIISEMIKYFFPVVRPFELNGLIPLTITIPWDNSFPSAHAAVAFSCAVGIWLHNKSIGNKFLVMAFLVASGRVLSNVHSLLDVIVGAALGTMIAFFVGKLHVYKLLK